jgi:hypothetical protein
MLYIDYVYIDHEFMGSILPCCYACGVRHGLTLAISPTLQCVVRCCSEEGQRYSGVFRRLIEVVGICYLQSAVPEKNGA